MKLSLLVFLFLGSASAVAEQAALPANLKCTSTALEKSVQAFEIYALNSEEPGSNIGDTSLLDFKSTGGLTSVSFSNECDNSYDVVFFTQDLWSLQRGEITEVKGLLYYYNADPLNETLAITCK